MKRHLWNEAISALFLLFFDLTELGNGERDQNGDDDIGNHIEAVITDGVDQSQKFTAENAEDLLAKGSQGVLREPPFGPGAVENVAGNNVGEIAQSEGNENSENESTALALKAVAEQAAKTEDGVGYKIIENENTDGGYDAHVIIAAGHEQCHDRRSADAKAKIHDDLNNSIGEGRKQTPFNAVHVRYNNNGKHGGQCDAAAHGKVEERDQGTYCRQDRCQCEHDGRYRQAFDLCGFHLKNLPFVKLKSRTEIRAAI